MSTTAPFTLRGRNPDVLSCIANLSNDEVFTPPEFANRMLDTLAEGWAASHNGANIWADPTVTFLDPCTKSGVFLREITRRLIDGLATQIPDLEARVEHILTTQVYGIAITHITSLLARRSLYCSKHAQGAHSIAKTFASDAGNIWFERLQHTWDGDKCRYCGAGKSVFNRGEGLESHAYAFIHTDNIKTRLGRMFGGKMQFDVIIGNPPYQLNAGDTSDTPIYHLFVQQAISLEPRFLIMITPSRWFTGGKGLDSYRQKMISDRHIRILVDFPHSFDTFPGVEIKGGVSYFLWNRDQEGDCEFITFQKGEEISRAFRDLRDGKGVVIRDNRASSIIEKVLKHADSFLSEKVSPQTPFGIYTNFNNWHKVKHPGDIQLFKRGLEEAWVAPQYVTTRKEWISKIKVIMSYAYNGGDSLPHQIIGRPFIIPANSAVTQTYMVAGVFDEIINAENFVEYLRTRFVRFLIRQRKISQHNRPDTFAFVPDLPMNQNWNDEKLYRIFGIDLEEQKYIESVVKHMPLDAEVGGGDDE